MLLLTAITLLWTSNIVLAHQRDADVSKFTHDYRDIFTSLQNPTADADISNSGSDELRAVGSTNVTSLSTYSYIVYVYNPTRMTGFALNKKWVAASPVWCDLYGKMVKNMSVVSNTLTPDIISTGIYHKVTDVKFIAGMPLIDGLRTFILLKITPYLNLSKYPTLPPQGMGPPADGTMGTFVFWQPITNHGAPVLQYLTKPVSAYDGYCMFYKGIFTFNHLFCTVEDLSHAVCPLDNSYMDVYGAPYILPGGDVVAGFLFYYWSCHLEVFFDLAQFRNDINAAIV